MTKLASSFSLNSILTSFARRIKALEERANSAQTSDDGGYLWKQHGILTGIGQASQDTNINNLLTLISNSAKGGETRPDYGDTMADNIVIPENRAITIKGFGSGWRSTGGAGSRIRRKSAAGSPTALMFCSGTGLTDSTRGLGRVQNLMLHGGRDSGFMNQGPLLTINRGQQIILQDLYLFQNDGYGLTLGNFTNSYLNEINITHCGTPTLDAFGRVQSAMFVGAAGTTGTVRFLANNIHIEQSFCTDIRLGNADDSNGYVTEFVINGLSMEGGLNSSAVAAPIPYPYLHLGFAEIGVINGLHIFSHRSVPNILVEHPSGGGAGADQDVQINGGSIIQSPSVADPDYMVEVTGGSIHFNNFEFRGKPNIAYIRIGPDVRPGNVSFDGRAITRDGTTPPTLVKDERAIPEFF